MAKEINLVPDIKNEFIKALKFRNFVFFLSGIVAAGSMIIILIFLTIAGGQQGFINAKQNTIDALEQKISEYNDLSDFLTIRDQLGNIATITENKVMMSRTFNVLAAIIPTGEDYINISELNVNLSEDAPTFRVEAQANAGIKTEIDYVVLDSFKKSMSYMRYDYGEYVDKNDASIPAYCMIESAVDGSTFKDANKGYYAYWLIEGEGCNPSAPEEEEEPQNNNSNNWNNWDNEEDEENSENPTPETPETPDVPENEEEKEPTPEELAELSQKLGYTIERYEKQNVVRIWRTPQYTDWYKTNPKDDEPHIDLDGSIHNVAHFNSSCINYSGEEKEKKDSDGNKSTVIEWSATNDSCKLVPGSDQEDGGINVESSSNGRDSSEQLVLRFTATITFAPEVFNFNNHHMLALSPSGRYNVTDSYSQIQGIFAERANDCESTDTACITTPTSADDQRKEEE